MRRHVWIGIGCYLLWYVVFSTQHPLPVVDETVHQAAIVGISEGRTETPDLPMLPGYHWLIASLSALAGPSLSLSRFFTVVISALALPLHASMRWPHHTPVGRSPLMLAFLPLLLPYTAMVYTDGAGLLLILAAIWAQGERRHLLSAGLGFSACLIRQSSLVWVAYLATCGALQVWEARRRPEGEPAAGRIGWSQVAPVAGHALALAGIGLVLLGRGSLLASQVALNRPQVNVSNYFEFAFLALLLWAPIWMERARSELAALYQMASARPLAATAVAAALVAAGAGLVATYQNWHPWNQYNFYLGNYPLIAMQKFVAVRAVGVLCLFTAAWLVGRWWAAQANRLYLALLLAFSVAFLSFHSSVDPRYFIVPVVVADLLVTYTPAQERVLTAWYAAISVAVAFLVVTDRAFW